MAAVDRLLKSARCASVCRAAVVADDEAGDVHRFEIGERETRQAGQIVIVPAGIGRADEAAALTVVCQDDPEIAQADDDDRRLRTARRASR
jgi:hypothetical protein